MSNSVIPLLAAGLASISVALILGGVSALFKRDVVQARLGEFAVVPRTLEELELSQPFGDRITRPFFRTVSGFVVRYTPQQSVERLRRDLILAGNPGRLDAADFLGIKGMATLIIGGVLTLALAGLTGLGTSLLIGLCGGLLGYTLPSFWLRSRIGARRKQIIRALPDALDLLVISVEAGLGFDAAMQKVAEKWDNELTREFGRALSEMRVGASRREALRGIAERTDAQDVASFTSAIIQADQLGVSVGRVLHIQADQMRMKRRQRAEEMAHKAPIKMLFPMILLIFPAMYIVILGPAIPQILKGLGPH